MDMTKSENAIFYFLRSFFYCLFCVYFYSENQSNYNKRLKNNNKRLINDSNRDIKELGTPQQLTPKYCGPGG